VYKLLFSFLSHKSAQGQPQPLPPSQPTLLLFPPPDIDLFYHAQIYPGRGRTFVTRSGAKVTLFGSKTASLYKQRKKGAKLMWTQPWRRMHKKVNSDQAGKRKVRKVVKTVATRAMEGRDSATVSFCA